MENIRTYLIPFLYSLGATVASYTLLVVANVHLFTHPYPLTVVVVVVISVYMAELSFGAQRSTHHHSALHTWMVWLLVRTALLPHYIPVATEGAAATEEPVQPNPILTLLLLAGLLGVAWGTVVPAVQDSRLSLQLLFACATALVALVPLALGPEHVDMLGVGVAACAFFFLYFFARTYVSKYLGYSAPVHSLVTTLHTVWVLVVPDRWWPVVLMVAAAQGVFYHKMMAHGRVVLPRHRAGPPIHQAYSPPRRAMAEPSAFAPPLTVEGARALESVVPVKRSAGPSAPFQLPTDASMVSPQTELERLVEQSRNTAILGAGTSPPANHG